MILPNAFSKYKYSQEIDKLILIYKLLTRDKKSIKKRRGNILMYNTVGFL